MVIKLNSFSIQNGLTLEELASRSELTKGFLSQLERNLTSPSITTLADIVEALGSSMSDFLKKIPKKKSYFKKRTFL